MSRSNWDFQYTCGAVAKAANGRLTHHQTRLDYWNDEVARIKKEVEDAGLVIREQQMTGGVQYQIVADLELQARFNTAQDKVQNHRSKIREYAKWVAVLSHRPEDEVIWLDMDDILFFDPEGNI
jgi:hypothetical protein